MQGSVGDADGMGGPPQGPMTARGSVVTQTEGLLPGGRAWLSWCRSLVGDTGGPPALAGPTARRAGHTSQDSHVTGRTSGVLA